MSFVCARSEWNDDQLYLLKTVWDDSRIVCAYIRNRHKFELVHLLEPKMNKHDVKECCNLNYTLGLSTKATSYISGMHQKM